MTEHSDEIRAALADAWDEGAQAAQTYEGRGWWEGDEPPRNPYRDTQPKCIGAEGCNPGDHTYAGYCYYATSSTPREPEWRCDYCGPNWTDHPTYMHRGFGGL